jgi:hypothetical protein
MILMTSEWYCFWGFELRRHEQKTSHLSVLNSLVIHWQYSKRSTALFVYLTENHLKEKVQRVMSLQQTSSSNNERGSVEQPTSTNPAMYRLWNLKQTARLLRLKIWKGAGWTKACQRQGSGTPCWILELFKRERNWTITNNDEEISEYSTRAARDTLYVQSNEIFFFLDGVTNTSQTGRMKGDSTHIVNPHEIQINHSCLDLPSTANGKVKLSFNTAHWG